VDVLASPSHASGEAPGGAAVLGQPTAGRLSRALEHRRHRSLGLDLLILCETLSTLVFEREPVVSEERLAYVGGGELR
jgi:hypothetical protein